MHFRQAQSTKKAPVYAKCNSLVNTWSGGCYYYIYDEEGKASLGKCLPWGQRFTWNLFRASCDEETEVSIHTWIFSPAIAAWSRRFGLDNSRLSRLSLPKTAISSWWNNWVNRLSLQKTAISSLWNSWVSQLSLLNSGPKRCHLKGPATSLYMWQRFTIMELNIWYTESLRFSKTTDECRLPGNQRLIRNLHRPSATWGARGLSSAKIL